MADKRNSKRKIKRLPVAFLCGTEECRGISSNMSHTGLFIKSRKTFKRGQTLKMVLDLDGNRKIALQGVVAREINRGFRNNNNGMGVELAETPREYTEMLKDMFEKDM